MLKSFSPVLESKCSSSCGTFILTIFPHLHPPSFPNSALLHSQTVLTFPVKTSSTNPLVPSLNSLLTNSEPLTNSTSSLTLCSSLSSDQQFVPSPLSHRHFYHLLSIPRENQSINLLPFPRRTLLQRLTHNVIILHGC